jgi:predicted HTH transcriptional regulator
MQTQELIHLLKKLVGLGEENEWVEFKCGNFHPNTIGELISALSNGACLHNQKYGYLIYGVEDQSHDIQGTEFKPKKTKIGGEDIEHWLLNRLNPRIDFRIYEFDFQNKPVVLIEIPAAATQPTRFLHKAYIRIGSYTKQLGEYPEKERKIWNKTPLEKFESNLVMQNLSGEEVVKFLDVQSYFDLMKLPFPSTREGILEKFAAENLIAVERGRYHITNLGGILFAKNLDHFGALSRKAVRVIVYEGKNRIKTLKDFTLSKGYAIGFEGLIEYINDKLPSNEEIGRALRKTVRMYPEIAVRELVANAIIHQNFSVTGTGTVVEIFADRIEITNPGKPVITTMRFIDEYQSRNEKLASFLRRIGICEEQGSGIDKVILNVELFQLPAPEFVDMEKHTKVILYSYQKLDEMSRNDKIRACYQHACLKYVSNEKMTNQSLRERFKIDSRNSAMASRIIDATLKAGLIKFDDPENPSKKYAKYIPVWA